jgi:PST family polysaccharide transporter
MISKYLSVISKKLKNEEIKTIIKNFISLSSLNLLSFIFPLLLIPYLTRTIGVEYYGEYIFSFSIFQYCLLLINFGFDYSATKLISVNRDDKSMVSDILTNITVIRLIFALFISILLWLSFIISPNLSSNKLLYLFGFGILWGQAITPFWLFQGLEKMGNITIINLLTRIVSTGLIFVFIQKPMDYYLINLFQSIGFLISGFASLVLINYHLKIQFSKPSISRMKFYLLDSWHIFLSTVSMSFYREANIIILGLTTNYALVGQYAAIEKVIKAMQSIMEPLSKSLFPFFGRKLNNSSGFVPSFVKFAKIYGLLLLLLTITLYIIGPYLLIWYLGNSFISSIVIFQILLPAILMKRQRSFIWINLLGTLCLIFVVSLPYIGAMHYSFYEILKLLSVSQSVFLLIVLIWMLIVAKNDKINSINQIL